MVTQPKTTEEISDLRTWLVSLVEDMPVERLVKLANAVEDTAFTNEGNDPFYSEENMARLKASVQELRRIHGSA